MKKRIVSLTMALALVFSLSISASAAPRWNQIDACDLSLMFSGTTADCYVGIIGKSGTSLIRATVYLQKVNSNGSYTLVKSWTEEIHGANYDFGESVTGCTSGKYRLYVNAMVYNTSGKGEGVTGEAFSSL